MYTVPLSLTAVRLLLMFHSLYEDLSSLFIYCNSVQVHHGFFFFHEEAPISVLRLVRVHAVVLSKKALYDKPCSLECFHGTYCSTTIDPSPCFVHNGSEIRPQVLFFYNIAFTDFKKHTHKVEGFV